METNKLLKLTCSTLVCLTVGIMIWLFCVALRSSPATAEPQATAMPKSGAAAEGGGPPPLLAHVLTPPPQWTTAYADEPVERVCTVWTLQVLRQTAIAQARAIDALTARVAALEAAGKTIDDATVEATP